ncbi:PAS-domain containing protein, partial [Rhizobium ruizarguesonis]
VVFEATVRVAPASQNIVLADGRVIKITHNPMQNGGYVATHEDVTKTVRLAEELRQHALEFQRLPLDFRRAALNRRFEL